MVRSGHVWRSVSKEVRCRKRLRDLVAGDQPNCWTCRGDMKGGQRRMWTAVGRSFTSFADCQIRISRRLVRAGDAKTLVSHRADTPLTRTLAAEALSTPDYTSYRWMILMRSKVLVHTTIQYSICHHEAQAVEICIQSITADLAALMSIVVQVGRRSCKW